jgi:hypothetical protein
LIALVRFRYSHHTAMKLASISVVTVSLLFTLTVMGVASAGCSSPRTHPTTDTGVRHMDAGTVPIPDGSVPHVDTGVVPHDTGVITPRDTGRPATDGGGSGTCTAMCTSDSVCTTMCGAVPGGGIRCCDHSTSRCFVSHTASCPAASPDSGGMSY